MEIDWNDILLALSSALFTGITLLATLGIKYLRRWVSASILELDSEYARNVVLDAERIVEQAVEAVAQTYVDELKEKNAFDPAAQKIAIAKAKARAYALLSEQTQKYIRERCGDLELWLETQIEKAIHDLRKE